MAGENTSTTLDALFKDVFLTGETAVGNVVPEVNKLQRLIKLNSDLNPGDKFVQMIETALEQGITYAGPTEDVVTLNSSEASASGEAQVQPYQIYERATIGYNALDKAEGGDKKAFRSATEHVVMNMLRSARKRVEIDLIYGNRPLATVTSLSSQVISILATDGSSTWAPGLWRGMKNAYIDVFQSDGSTSRQAGLKITSVDLANKTITVSGTTTGIASTDLIYFKGANSAGTLKSMIGLDRLATNTGTLYNIDASTNEGWKANSYAVSGNLSMLKVLEAVDQSGLAGCDEDVVALIPWKAYAKMNNDQSLFRGLDGSYKRDVAVNGVKSIEFEGQTGKINLVPHPYLKESEGFIFAPGNTMRIGKEITFARPGPGGKAGDGKIFRELADNTGFELRCWTKQTVYTPNPAWVTKLTGISYA